jgi:uncharacterized protein (TIGR00288 family)
MVYEHKRYDVAVFIDFENVYVSVRDKLDANPNFESIMERCSDLGRVVIARAYADWYRYPRVTSALYANGIEPMYVPTYYYDKEMGRTGRAIKNSVDMNLCIDAMKTLYTNTNIGRFVLITGDRDFIPLVNSIRQQGKEVYIIGIGGAASTHLAQSADEFIFYEQLVGKAPPASRIRTAEPVRVEEPIDEPPPALPVAPPPAPVATTPPAPAEIDIYQVLIDAVHLVRKRGYVSTLGSLKLVMKELMGGDFKESRYKDLNGRPFAKFKDFVIDAERRGKVQIFTSGTVNEVFLPGEDPYKLSQFASDLKASEGLDIPPEVSVLTNGHKEAPLLPPVEEPAPPAAPTGRRRRRRSRGGQRQANTATADLEALLGDEGDEEFTAPVEASADELQDLDALDVVAEVVALFDETPQDEVLASDLPDEYLALDEDPLQQAYAAAEAEMAREDLVYGEVIDDAQTIIESTDGLEFVDAGVVDALIEAVIDNAIAALEAEGELTVDSIDLITEVNEAGDLVVTEIGLVIEDNDGQLDDDEMTIIAEAVANAAADLLDEPVLVDTENAALVDEPLLVDTENAALVDEPLLVGTENAALVDEPLLVEPEMTDLADEPLLVEPESSELVDEPLLVEPVVDEPVSEFEPAQAEIAAVAAEVIAAVDEAPAEAVVTVAAESDGDDDVLVIDEIDFSDEEWAVFYEMMGGFSKPVSFATMFDTLRGLRKERNLTRTNEQLRTMVKQAINTGRLERSGRGKRVYYTLKREE